MALTARQLAAEIGISIADPDNAQDPGLLKATRLLAVANSLITAELNGATDCPPEIVTEAVIRTAGNLTIKTAGFGVVEGPYKVDTIINTISPAASSAVRQSGARALLAPWRKRSA